MRIKFTRICFFSLMFLICVRLGYWQLIKQDFLTAKAESQHTDSKTVPGTRGLIRFSDKSILASTEPSFLVFAQPKIIDDKEMVSDFLSEVFYEEDPLGDDMPDTERNIKIRNIRDKIRDSLAEDLYWVSLRKVSLETKRKIEKKSLRGIGFDRLSIRFYPEGSSAAHLLGFVGSNAYGGETGYFGLEGYYDGELRGEKGLLRQEKDALGFPILIGKFFAKEPKVGKTLILSADRTVQYIVEEKLKRGIEKYGAKAASALVMDPVTGNILAMASFPSYDPAKPSSFPKEYYKNPLIADGYEPGSTFKVIVMAAGINENVVKADTKCDICGAPLSRGGFTIKTWNNKYQESVTMTDTIVHSDNTGMVFVAEKLGLEKFYDYLVKFGFGNATNIDLQDENSLSLRPLESWREIDLATASFGQGISVTAIQLVRAVSAIANGGKIMEPHMVASLVDKELVYPILPREISKPISSEAAKVITEMMVKAVDEGEAKFAKPKGYKIAGKTGTAQIPIKGHYDPDKTIASFIGFAPADNPKFIMLVRYQEPTSSIYGAETAAPTFFEIARELFIYYGIAPDG